MINSAILRATVKPALRMNKRVTGVLGLSLLLVGYCIFTTIRARNLEQRVKKMEAAYQQLQAKHLALTDYVLRATNASPLAAQQVKVDLLREGFGLPPATVVEQRPTATELNPPPRSMTSE